MLYYRPDMAKTRSAKKAKRVASRRRVFNMRRTRAMKGELKEVKKLIATKNSADAAARLPALYKALDKAAKHGTIKKNAASRMKSRLTKRAADLTK